MFNVLLWHKYERKQPSVAEVATMSAKCEVCVFVTDSAGSAV